VLIPHQGGAEFLPGTGVPQGPLAPCTPGCRGPSQREMGGGCPRCRILPALPGCPRAHANPAAAHGLKSPRLLQRHRRQPGRRGRLGSSSALQLDVCKGGIFLAGKRAPRHAGQGGLWVPRAGCPQPQGGCCAGDAARGRGCRRIPCSPHAGFRRSGGADARELPGVWRGWRRRRRVLAHAACPPARLGLSQGSEGGGSQARGPPTCSEGSLRAGDVSRPKGWLCTGPRGSPRPSCPGRGHTRGVKSCAGTQKDGARGKTARQSPRGAGAAGREPDPSPGCTVAGWGEMLRGGITPQPPSTQSHGVGGLRAPTAPGTDIAARPGHSSQVGFWRRWLVNPRTGKRRKDQQTQPHPSPPKPHSPQQTPHGTFSPFPAQKPLPQIPLLAASGPRHSSGCDRNLWQSRNGPLPATHPLHIG